MIFRNAETRDYNCVLLDVITEKIGSKVRGKGVRKWKGGYLAIYLFVA